MSRRLSALLVWMLVAATAVFWALRLLAQPIPLPPSARLAVAQAPHAAEWSRLLGAPGKAVEPVVMQPALASRFRLTGVAAAAPTAVQPSRAPGFALIAVDGKPARAYRVGQRIDGEFILRSVSLRSATIGTAAQAPQEAGTLVLELPPVVLAATGALPAPGTPMAAPLLPAPSFPAPPVAPPTVPVAPPAAAAETPAVPQTAEMRASPLAR